MTFFVLKTSKNSESALNSKTLSNQQFLSRQVSLEKNALGGGLLTRMNVSSLMNNNMVKYYGSD